VELDNNRRLQALFLINDCYSYITTKGIVIIDTPKFTPTNKENLIIFNKEDGNDSKGSGTRLL
jgi:hypothetical protein